MSPERQPLTPENGEQSRAELEKLAGERLEELKSGPETGAESGAERAEAAREAIQKHETAPEPAPQVEAQPTAPGFVARLDAAVNYTHTVQSLQRRLGPASRRFSQVIHTPAVERASEALETTVMRPSVVSGGLWSAAIVGLGFYLVARHYGYALSGTEMLVALVVGGVIGYLVELVTRKLRPKRS